MQLPRAGEARNPRPRTDTERMSEWRNEIVPLRTHEPLPTTTKAPRASMIGRTHSKFAFDWPSRKKNPLALPPLPLSLSRRAIQPFAHPSSYLMTDLPRHPFLRLSPYAPHGGEKKGYVSDNGTEPIRSVRENGFTRRHWFRARA